MRPRSGPDFGGFLWLEKRIVIKTFYSAKRSQTGMGKACGTQVYRAFLKSCQGGDTERLVLAVT